MKLAEALITRADIQNRISALRDRLNANAVVQEGETCAEDPEKLLRELNELSDELETLITRINLTNAQVMCGGAVLTLLLARRDCLKQKISIMRDFIYQSSDVGRRVRGSEIRLAPSLPVHDMQSQVDKMSAELRQLDITIQQANWTNDLT